MTLKITKLKLALAIVVMALLVPATAIATHTWSDVPTDKFYHDAVEWAEANGMTTGCNGGTAFCPEDSVTRGENITFAKRYDDFVVQPALTDIEDNVATVASDVNNSTRVYFARVGIDGLVDKTSHTGITSAKTATGEFTVTLPEAAANCTVETSFYTTGTGFGLLPIVGFADGVVFAFHDTAGASDEVSVRTIFSGAATDLPFSVTAYCTNTFFIFDPGIIIPPIIIFP